MISVAGVPAVKYLVLSGRIIDIEEAKRFGLVTAAVEDEDFDAEVGKLASQIANGAPLAARDHKIMIRRLSVKLDTEDLDEDDFQLAVPCIRFGRFPRGCQSVQGKTAT